MNQDESTRQQPINELIEAARPTMLGILRRFGIPPQDADDLLQEALLSFVRKRPEVRSPKKWLAGALRRECLQYWRKRARALYDAVDQAMLDLVADDSEDPQEDSVLKRRMREQIATLQPKCRSVLVLRYRLGYDNREIAEETGYRPSSVDKIAQRCVAALSRRLLGRPLIPQHRRS